MEAQDERLAELPVSRVAQLSCLNLRTLESLPNFRALARTFRSTYTAQLASVTKMLERGDIESVRLPWHGPLCAR